MTAISTLACPHMLIPWVRDSASIRRRMGALMLCIVFAALITSTPALAQDKEKGAVAGFVDGIGEMMYFLAWPSATYKNAKLGGVTNVQGGMDIRIRLNGTSAFDDSPLWTDVIVMVRDGSIKDFRWGQNNAVMFQPGETISALGQAMVELNKQYKASNGSATASRPRAPEPEDLRLAALCLGNPAKQPITYYLKWPDGRKDERMVKPGEAYIYWTAESQPDLQIYFDDNFEAGYTGQTRRLRAFSAKPSNNQKCDDFMNYIFVVDGNRIGMSTNQWLPGFPHPWKPNVVQARDTDRWTCEAGYKWSAPGDTTLSDCVDRSIGLVGVLLSDEPSAPYPLIYSVSKGGAAERAGIPAGGRLVSINKVPVKGRTVAEVIPVLRGPVGSVVQVEFLTREGAQASATLTRY